MTRIHKHLYSQGQLTIVHLFWTDVLSGSTAQVSVLSFTQRRPRLSFPRSYSPRVPDREPLFSPRWAAIISSVWPYYAEPLRLGHAARGPCHVAVSPHSKCSETVMVMMAMIVMMAAMPLFMASTHRLSGLHCSATFIKSQ